MKEKVELILLCITCFLLGFILSIDVNKYNNYDVNQDGQVNSKDLLSVQKYLLENWYGKFILCSF